MAITQWFEENTEKLIVGAGMLAIGLLEAIAFGLDGMPDETSRVIDLLDDIDEKSDTFTSDGDTSRIQAPCDVKEHVRKLPKGWNPSPEKLAEAEENGIELEPGETYVRKYHKNGRRQGLG